MLTPTLPKTRPEQQDEASAEPPHIGDITRESGGPPGEPPDPLALARQCYEAAMNKARVALEGCRQQAARNRRRSQVLHVFTALFGTLTALLPTLQFLLEPVPQNLNLLVALSGGIAATFFAIDAYFSHSAARERDRQTAWELENCMHVFHVEWVRRTRDPCVTPSLRLEEAALLLDVVQSFVACTHRVLVSGTHSWTGRDYSSAPVPGLDIRHEIRLEARWPSLGGRKSSHEQEHPDR